MSSEIIALSIAILFVFASNIMTSKRVSKLEDISELFILYLAGDKNATECVINMRREYQKDAGEAAYRFESGVVSQEGSISSSGKSLNQENGK